MMTDKNTDGMMELAGHKHLPVWFKTVMAAIVIPPMMAVLMFFFLTKFTGLEAEFKMIAEAYAYDITGGPINKDSTEMGKMVDMMAAQLEAVNAIRSDNTSFRDEVMSAVYRIEGKVDSLTSRVAYLESWAARHSQDPKAMFSGQ